MRELCRVTLLSALVVACTDGSSESEEGIGADSHGLIGTAPDRSVFVIGAVDDPTRLDSKNRNGIGISRAKSLRLPPRTWSKNPCESAGILRPPPNREAKLCIELDGGRHAETRQAEYDRRRDEALARLGLRVLRLWNPEVIRALDTVLGLIWDCLHGAPVLPLRDEVDV